jgi:hypothetical protein
MNLEQAVRDYLQSDTEVMALLSNDEKRMNMDFKGDERSAHVTIYRAGGRANDYFPHDYPIIALNCFATSRSAAAAIADAVALSMRAITQANTPLVSASVESLIYLPTVDGTARYVVTTVVTAQLATAA